MLLLFPKAYFEIASVPSIKSYVRASTLKIIHWSFSWSDVFVNRHSSALTALLPTSSTDFSRHLLLKLFSRSPGHVSGRTPSISQQTGATGALHWHPQSLKKQTRRWRTTKHLVGLSSTSASLRRKEKSGQPSLKGGRLWHLGAFWWVWGGWGDPKQKWIESGPLFFLGNTFLANLAIGPSIINENSPWDSKKQMPPFTAKVKFNLLHIKPILQRKIRTKPLQDF